MDKFTCLVVLVVSILSVVGCKPRAQQADASLNWRGENCSFCGETALDHQKCSDLGYHHAVLRACDNYSACLFCANERGELTPVEDPYNSVPVTAASEKPGEKKSAVVTPEMRKNIEKCVEAGKTAEIKFNSGLVLCTSKSVGGE